MKNKKASYTTLFLIGNSPKRTRSNSQMPNLPDEVLQSAFSHIPDLATLNRIRRSCKRFNDLLQDDYCWLLLARQQGIDQPPISNSTPITPTLHRTHFLKQYLTVYPPSMGIIWLGGEENYWELVESIANYSGTIHSFDV
jgi:hypothetical protein